VIRVCIAGITGWVGRPLAEAVQRADDLELVAGVARGGGVVDGVKVFASVPAVLSDPTVAFDVMVDYTSALAVAENVREAVRGGRHVVVGSSGTTDAEYEEIDALARARGVGVIAGGNFSLSAALLQRFAVEAAKYFPVVEVVDVAHHGKIDAPSGTARELAWRLGQVTGSPPPVHSIRLHGYTIGVEARFGAPSERLTLHYDGGAGAEPYIAGTLLAIRKVATVRGLVRGFDTIL
jgi:4-hydroxy-tetrahydrodipicolinate reductase